MLNAKNNLEAEDEILHLLVANCIEAGDSDAASKQTNAFYSFFFVFAVCTFVHVVSALVVQCGIGSGCAGDSGGGIHDGGQGNGHAGEGGGTRWRSLCL